MLFTPLLAFLPSHMFKTKPLAMIRFEAFIALNTMKIHLWKITILGIEKKNYISYGFMLYETFTDELSVIDPLFFPFSYSWPFLKARIHSVFSLILQ